MQDKLRMKKTEESLPISRSETELLSGPQPLSVQWDDSEHAELSQPIRPEGLGRVSVHQKAMPSSTPGSEYWLP
jgi:hypothetical protein